MLDKDKASEIFEQIKKYSSADEVEILFYGGKSALTRFANNTIHQNVAGENYVVSVRTAFGGPTARGSPNELRNESFQRGGPAAEGLPEGRQPEPRFLSHADGG